MKTVAAIFLWMIAPLAAHAASGIAIDGTLLKPDGQPVTESAVQFRVQIRTPGAEDCLLYEEIQTLNLSSTHGMFALSVGDGTGTRQDLNAWNLFDAISNRKSFSFSGGDCVGSPTYAPNSTDNRRVKIYFNDGSFAGWEEFPVQTLNYTPMAIEAYAVGGFPASSLLRVETSGTLENTSPLNNTQYNSLLTLVNGTSTLYAKSGEMNGVSLPVLSNGEAFRWSGGAWQAFTPLSSESDPTVEAFAKSALPTCGVGQVLKSDGTSFSCVVDSSGGGVLSVSGTTPLSVNNTDPANPVVSLNLVESDVPTLTDPGKVSGDAITGGTIGGTTEIYTSGSIYSNSNVKAPEFMSPKYYAEEASASLYPYLKLRRARGSTMSPATVSVSDPIGRISFEGYDGSAYLPLAAIAAQVTSTVSPGAVPMSLTFSTGTSTLAEAMRITPNGNVGVGTANPSVKLHVNGELRVDTLATATATTVCIDGNNVLAACSSSIRYKENVKSLDPALDTILNLRPVSYDWKSSKEHDLGFIAEEVEQVNPDLVTYKNNRIQGVKYDQITAPLVKAVQEIYAMITGTQADVRSLQQENEALRRELSDLKSRLDRLEQSSP